MPINQAWQLVAIAQRAKVCDTLVQYQETVIQLGIRAQASTDSVLVLTQKELTAVKGLSSLWEDKYNIQVKLTKVAIHQKRKWVEIAIVAIIVVVVETALVIVGASH